MPSPPEGAPPSTTTLSEADSKALLAPYGVPFLPEVVAAGVDDAVAAADQLGYPVVAKLNGDHIAHKTERGLVRLGLGDAGAVARATAQLLAAATPDDGEVTVLVAPMVHSVRELIVGLSRDPQFGPTVMVGVGGILAEAIGDVALRLVPIEQVDAHEMLEDLATQTLLGPFRGEPAIDLEPLVEVLVGLSRLASERPEVHSVDLNPVMVLDGRPVAVDALVEVAG